MSHTVKIWEKIIDGWIDPKYLNFFTQFNS